MLECCARGVYILITAMEMGWELEIPTNAWVIQAFLGDIDDQTSLYRNFQNEMKF